MSTLVIRPRKRDRDKPGMVAERMIAWPEGAVLAERNFRTDRWKFTYRTDVLREKRERMERNLRRKREAGLLEHRALLVWVFWCPGIAGFAFRGWWTYLIGIGGRKYSGGGHKGDADETLRTDIMRLFPVDSPCPLVGPPNYHDWMPLFARKHQRGTWCRKPQGKATVWAWTEGDRVIAIDSAAKAQRVFGVQQ